MTTNRMELDAAAEIETAANAIGVTIDALACYAGHTRDRVVVQVPTYSDVEKLARALPWVETDRDEYHPAEEGLVPIASVYGVLDDVPVRIFGRLVPS